MAIYAGFSKIDITPRPGMPMAGYINRFGRAVGAYDSLYARAMYISDGNTEALFIVADIIRVDRDLYEKLVSYIESVTGIPRDSIFISATHTHSGPEVSLSLWSTKELSDEERELVAKYREELSRAIAMASLRAIEDAEEVQLYVSKARISGVAVNRIDPNREVDNEALVVIAKSSRGPLKGLSIVFPCHPTVLGPDNLLYSGDLYGYASRELEKIFGIPVLLFNSAAGNVSTRFSRRAQNYEEVIRLGSKIVDGIVDSLRDREEIKRIAMRILRRTLTLKLREFPIEQLVELKRRVEKELEKARKANASHGVIRFLESNLYGIEIALKRTKLMSSMKYIDVDVNAIAIDNVLYITFPGELFVEYQLELKRALLDKARCAIIGYTNGYIGYVPHYSYRAETTYENLVSIVDPNEFPELERILISLAREAL